MANKRSEALALKFSSVFRPTVTACRFKVYVKAAANNTSIGDCPFCQHVCMVMSLKMPEYLYTICPVSRYKRQSSFRELNSSGRVPVLVDTDEQIVLRGSSNIVTYINKHFPQPDLMVGYKGPVKYCCAGIFPALAKMLMNKDQRRRKEFHNELLTELSKLNNYLACEHFSGPYLLGNTISDLDCALLPQLRHVMVAGHYYRNFTIPDKMMMVQLYMMHGATCQTYRSTCCPIEEILKGWAYYNVDKVESDCEPLLTQHAS